MSSPHDTLKVAVVGGGVLGVSTAQQLARAGADVVLVTEGELTSGASGRSLSWLNSVGIRSERYHRLRMAGIDRYRTLSAQHPGLELAALRRGTGLAGSGGTTCTASTSTELARGYDSQLLTSDQVAAHVPGVNAAAVPPPGPSGDLARAGSTCRASSDSWPRTSSSAAGNWSRMLDAPGS